MTLLAVTLALLSAATFAVSSSVQHHAAESAPPSGLAGLLGYLVRRPLWLVGQLLATVGFALHAVALHTGPIAVVQPIVVSGIVWAVPVRAAISRRMPSGTEVSAVLVTAAGLAVFLVASDPSAGEPASTGGRVVALTAGLLAVALLANAVASRVRGAPRRKAFWLGATAGVLFGVVASMVKLAAQALDRDGLAGLLTAWPTYALLVVGATGVLTNQRAYRTAGLSASMPALNIVNGGISLFFGFTLFAEVPRHSPLFLLVEIGAVVAMAAGLRTLVRLEEEHQLEPVPVPVGDRATELARGTGADPVSDPVSGPDPAR